MTRARTWILNGREPEPCPDKDRWTQWFKSAAAERVVGFEKTGGERNVLTIFVGVDLVPTSDAPLLFETTISNDGKISLARRYSTWDEAAEGHKEIVKLVRLHA